MPAWMLVLAALAFGVLMASPAHAADPLCKPGHVLDETRGLCYDPAAAYRPNIPPQQPILGSGNAPAPAPATDAAKAGSGGFFGWLGEQARFCRYGDRQVGSGDAAYCVGRDGKPYPAGK